ncbi:MAG: hypothetical protein D6E12_16880 [Desulfovibrio sp.]|nr:MAG: hypothetical protein D6E12_16880 [Desulfovibrio sp.]
MHRSTIGTTLLALLIATTLSLSSFASTAWSSQTDDTETEALRVTSFSLTPSHPTQQDNPTPWITDFSGYTVAPLGSEDASDEVSDEAFGETASDQTNTPNPDLNAQLEPQGTEAAPRDLGNIWGLNLTQYHIPEMTFDPEEVEIAEPEPEPEPAPVQETATAPPPPPPNNANADSGSVAVAGNNAASGSVSVSGNNAETAPGTEVAAIPPTAVETPPRVPDTSSLEQEIVLDERGQKALEEFRSFAANRLSRIRNNLTATSANMEVEQVGNTYVARYYQIDPTTLSLQVKPVEYDHTPFVGVMRYQREIYEATGDTPEAAMAGSFVQVRDTKMTQIFRYTRNNWEE